MKWYYFTQLFYAQFHLSIFAHINVDSMRLRKIVTACIVLLIHLIQVNGQQWGDYTLYATQNGTSAFLIDTNNNVYHSWAFSSNAKTGYSTYLLPGGTVARAVARQGNQLNGPAMCGQVQKVNWSGTIIWDFIYSTSSYCSHHDICPMPNGNVLLICYEVKTAAEAIQAGCSQSITIWPEKIVEVQQTGATTGTIVWEWHIWDHLCQNYNPAKDNYVTSIVEHPELLNINYNTQKDWMHGNGIDYNETLDQIVLSSHNLNELYVIDHSTTSDEAAGHTGGNSGMGGDILYRWGNPQVYQAGNSSNKIFNVVHDAHWIPENCPNAGYLVGFNNNGISNNQSTVDMVDPPYNGYNYSITPGTAFLPSTFTLRHICNGHSNNMGNSQQLPNGNMLVCIAQSGYIYEIGPSGTLLWSKNVSGSTPMAFRYSACYVSGGNLSVEAEASDNDICNNDSVQLNAIASGGTTYIYNWTSNPAGFTSTLQNPIATPAETTTFIVTVTSEGCSATSSVVVVVFPVPETPVITQNGDTLVSSFASSYQWYFDGYTIEGATEQSLIPNQSGSYQVQTGDENECLSDFSEIFDFIFTGINVQNDLPDLKIFPNPTNGIFAIYSSELNNYNFRIWIEDIHGNIIFRGENKNTFDLTDRAKGVYFLFIKTSEAGVISGKIVLIH